MVINDAPRRAPESRTGRAPVTTNTENGFNIVRLGDLKDSSPSAPGEHCFVVRAPNGDEREIIVEFAPSAIALIEQKRSIPFSPCGSFWIDSAERSLGTYLWKRAQFPPGRRLIIDEACLNQLAAAGPWDEDAMPDQQENKSRNILRTRTLGRNFYLQSLIAILSLYLIAALAPRILGPDTARVGDSISGLILYAAIFLSGTLVGLTVIDVASARTSPKVTVASATNVPDRIIPISYNEKGLTPVERVIHGN